jgi:hypothetical protein
LLEEQGRSHLTDLLKRLLRFLGTHIKNLGKTAEQSIIHNISETGKKSVKNLVKKGRDLELSEAIKSKDHLKAICHQCQKQGIAFAVKKGDNGEFQLLYQRKDSALVGNAVSKVLNNKLKPKPSLAEMLQKNKAIKEPQLSKNAPIKHREVNAR